MPIPVFVVSLARAAERRRLICEHLAALGISYRLVDAVDGAKLSPSERDRYLPADSSMHAGAIGCYLSHIHIYEVMRDEQIPVALVLEDDARLSPRAVDLVQAEAAAFHFDYCFLDSDDHNDQGPIYYDKANAVAAPGGFRAHALSAGPQTTHAYLITLPAAQRRLSAAFPILRAIDLYDHLPYRIDFRAIVSPKLAWVSEHSLISFTSERNDDAQALSFAALRRSPAFYRLRDWLKLKNWRRSRAIRSLVRAGRLSAGGRWAPLPSGREVIFK
ncbi:glycosyltransferase family 25 protein [Aquincola tertiaricarbonis]|nr:glycosyltransferase family 25 protein [Aquincola tertiaricarbonis]URI10256.1 glycosyltransferase family 25 protein [Aquincola tertiaricarbonis]